MLNANYQTEIEAISASRAKPLLLNSIWQRQLEAFGACKLYSKSIADAQCTFYLNFSRAYLVVHSVAIIFFEHQQTPFDITKSQFLCFYEGQIKDFKANGKGLMIGKNLTLQCGDFRNNKLHGQNGRIKKKDGFEYQGEFYQGAPHGFGEESWPDGTHYRGQYINGQKEGRGKLSYSAQEYYEGDFLNNQFEGQGFYHWPDGRCYQGAFKQNKMSGYGEFRWSEAQCTVYRGEYLDDKKHGQGQLTFANGVSLCGNWQRGALHGEVSIIIPCNTKSIGKADKDRVITGVWSEGRRVQWLSDSAFVHQKFTQQIESAFQQKKIFKLEKEPPEQDNRQLKKFHLRGFNILIDDLNETSFRIDSQDQEKIVKALQQPLLQNDSKVEERVEGFKSVQVFYSGLSPQNSIQTDFYSFQNFTVQDNVFSENLVSLNNVLIKRIQEILNIESSCQAAGDQQLINQQSQQNSEFQVINYLFNFLFKYKIKLYRFLHQLQKAIVIKMN